MPGGQPPRSRLIAPTATHDVPEDVTIVVEFSEIIDAAPFIGATIGWARHSADTERNLQDTNVFITDESDTDNLAYGGLVGVNWAFAENWSSEFSFRYLVLGEVNTGVFPTGESISVDEYDSQDFLITVKYDF